MTITFELKRLYFNKDKNTIIRNLVYKNINDIFNITQDNNTVNTTIIHIYAANSTEMHLILKNLAECSFSYNIKIICSCKSDYTLHPYNFANYKDQYRTEFLV